MPYTFDTALDDPDITVVDRNDDMGSYTIQVGSLQTHVRIELGRFPNSNDTKFIVSHAINTPTQTGPYRTSRPWADYPEYALHRAISGLTEYYRDAVKAGHNPKENWLVKY